MPADLEGLCPHHAGLRGVRAEQQREEHRRASARADGTVMTPIRPSCDITGTLSIAQDRRRPQFSGAVVTTAARPSVEWGRGKGGAMTEVEWLACDEPTPMLE